MTNKIAPINAMLRKINGARVPFVFSSNQDKKWGKLNGSSCAAAVLSEPGKRGLLILHSDWHLLKTDDRTTILFHESGHLNDKYIYRKSRPKRELFAQIWGIRRAKKMGWGRVCNNLINDLRNWREHEYNSNGRIYLQAYRLAVRKGILRRKLSDKTPDSKTLLHNSRVLLRQVAQHARPTHIKACHPSGARPSHKVNHELPGSRGHQH